MVGLDLTEQEFDTINQRVTAACNAAGITCEQYADKSQVTAKGFWMQVTLFERFFTQEELNAVVPYEPLEEVIEI